MTVRRVASTIAFRPSGCGRSNAASCHDSAVTPAYLARRRAARLQGVSVPHRLTWRGALVSLCVTAGFLAFAAFVSYVAPVAVLQLQRDDHGVVHARASQRLWLLVPYGTRVLGDVSGVDSRTTQQASYHEPGRRSGS